MLNTSIGFKTRKSEKQLCKIIDNSSDAVVVISKKGTVLFINTAAENFWKRKKENFIGEQFGIPIHGDDRSEISIFRPDGEPGMAEMRVIEIEWEGRMVYMATFQDKSHLSKMKTLQKQIEKRTQALEMMNRQLEHEIKERILAEESARKKEKLRGMLEMAGAVCHELNQPLQVLFGFLELLLMHEIEDEEILNKIERIKTQVERISDLTQKLTGITRYEAKFYIGETKIIDIENTKDRRAEVRYIPRKDRTIVLHFGSFRTDKIIDISRGGLAFWGEENLPMSNATNRLSIIEPENDWNIYNIPFNLLSKRKPVLINSQNRALKKRYRVRFGNMSTDQLNQMDQFLESHTSLSTQI